MNITEEMSRIKRLQEKRAFRQASDRLEKLLRQTDIFEHKMLLRLELGKTWLETGDHDKALTILKDAMTDFQNKPHDLEALRLERDLTLYTGRVYQSKGDLEIALDFYRKIVTEQIIDSISVEAYQRLGEIYFSQGNFKQAINNLDKAITCDPDFEYLVAHDIYYFLAGSYDKLDQPNTSVEYLERALAVFEPQKGQIEIWQIYFELANVLRQVFTLKKVTYFDPSNWVEWINHYLKVIDILEFEIKKTKKWLVLRNKVQLSQEKADALLRAYHYVGIFFFYTRKYQEAIRYLSKGINVNSQIQPDLAVIYLLLGASYFKVGDTQKGRVTYEILLEIDPGHQWAKNVFLVYHDLGQIYHKEKKYEQALKYLLKGLELDNLEPAQLADLHLGVGYTYYDMGSYQETAQHIREYLKLSDPKAPERKMATEYLVSANERIARKK